MMALHVFEPALPRKMVSPSAAVALFLLKTVTLLTLRVEVSSKLLCVALGGFLTLGYLEGPLQCKVQFREQVFLHRFAP